MSAPIGILYEHPEWFRPLFAELERRGLPFERLDTSEHTFDPGLPPPPYALVVNRMSPSAYLRGHGGAIAYSRELLLYLQQHGVPLVNGPDAIALEQSKARQGVLLQRLGIAYPRTRVVHDPRQIESAAAALEYPLMVKPNLGGSGALMRVFERPDELRAAVEAAELELGPDGIGLVQEYHPPRDEAIVRIEALNARYLYAIRVPINPQAGFNLCPADYCDLPTAAPRPIEACDPPAEAVEAVLRIMAAGQLDICGVEYLESERDGRRYFYDVNALSNFVADAPRILGFDPFVDFVDYLERRAGVAGRELAAAGA